jgi:antitoxin ParD1/3/4
MEVTGRGGLAKYCQALYSCDMGTMNISLPGKLKSFVEEQVASRGYGTTSEYVRELIRRDQERQHLRSLLVDGAASPPTSPVGDAYFADLRDRVRRNKSG